MSTVRSLPPGSGIVFAAGDGVGTVTRAGLPIEPGEAAINPVPRRMMREIVEEICAKHELPADILITITIPEGEELAQKTWNPRLGIVGGLSILGTTGVVHPFSCSAWIHSIHRGIDVARAANQHHVIASTGSTSEQAAQDLLKVPDFALLDMGDFAGGVLKYLRKHPVPRLTIAGGFAKITKLAQGAMDLHSGRSQVDFEWLAERIKVITGNDVLKKHITKANTALEVLQLAQDANIDIADAVARQAQIVARTALREAPVTVDVLIVDRQGGILTHAKQ